MNTEHVYITRTPDNLLSYTPAVVCERLKTRYRVQAENGSVLTFNNSDSVRNGFYIFAATDALNHRIENYKEREDELMTLISRSEKIQKALASQVAQHLSVEGGASLDLNNPEIDGSEFYISYND